MSHFQKSEINISNVYDFAYEIAQEFEKIVLLYGIDKVKPVIEKVINVLEILESSIIKIEQLETDLGEFKSNNLQLISEKVVNDHEKTKLKQIYEESEESWFAEILNLKSELSIIRSENDCLKNHLALKKDSSSKQDDTPKKAIQDQENIIHKLRYTLKQKDKQLLNSVADVEALNTRIEELLEINKVLHTKNQEAKTDISKLIIEKNDIKTELILLKKQNRLLNEGINELVSSCLTKQKGRQREHGEILEQIYRDSILEEIDSNVKPEIDILKKMKEIHSELQFTKCKPQQNEEKISLLRIDNDSGTFSKIHQLNLGKLTPQGMLSKKQAIQFNKSELK